MIKPEHLIAGERYGLAHDLTRPYLTRPCVHWNLTIIDDQDRARLLDRLMLHNEGTFHHNGWFVVVHNAAEDRWEILEVPISKSRYALFSED